MDNLKAPQPRRRFFQLHLSTCVVLMMVAGGLLALNLVPARFDATRGPTEFMYMDGPGDLFLKWFGSRRQYGWPWIYRIDYFTEDQPGRTFLPSKLETSEEFPIHVAFDILAAACVLALFGVTLEWANRFRESPPAGTNDA